MVVERQGSSQRSAGKSPVKQWRSEGDSQTIGIYRYRNNWIGFSILSTKRNAKFSLLFYRVHIKYFQNLKFSKDFAIYMRVSQLSFVAI